MANLTEYLKGSLNETRRDPVGTAKDVKTLKAFANFINAHPFDWEEYKDEIMKRNGWVEPEGDNPIERRTGKPRKVCQEKGNKQACVYYNDSFGYYVSREF